MVMLAILPAIAEETVVYTALFGSAYNSKSISGYTNNWSASNNGFTWNIVNFNNNSNSWAYIKAGSKNAASVASIATATPMPEAISKVVMTVGAVTASNINSLKLETSADADFSNVISTVNVTAAQGDLTFTLDQPQENLYYKITIDIKKSSNGTIQINKVEYYKNEAADSKTAVALSWSATTAKVLYGSTSVTLPTLTVDPAEAAEAVAYSSSNESVATISETGEVTPVAAGTTTIKAYIADDNETYKAASAEYTLSIVELSDFKPTLSPLTIGKGNSSKIDLGTDKPAVITYTSADPAIATVDAEGNVTAVAAGETDITITWEADEYYNAGSATVHVTVSNSLTASVIFSKIYNANVTNPSLKVGDIDLVFANGGGTNPQYYTNGTALRFYGKNTMTFTAPTGMVVTKVVITCASGYSFDAAADKGTYNKDSQTWSGSAKSLVLTNQSTSQTRITKVEVTYSILSATATEVALAWSAEAADVIKGSESNTFPTLSVNPEDAASIVVYSSSNEEVATIAENGEITLVAAGSAIITATIPDGNDSYHANPASYTLNVFVPAEYTLPTAEIKIFTNGVKKIALGEKYPASIRFESADPAIATVDEEGKVTGVAHGETTINVAWDGDKEFVAGTAAVKVIVALLDYTIETTEITLAKGETTAINLGEEKPAAITFTSADPAIATVDEEGNIVAVAVGETEITAEWAEDEAFNAGSATIKVTVTAKSKELLAYTALFGADYNSAEISSYTDTWTATNEGFTWELDNFNNNKNSWDYIKAGRKGNKSVAYIVTTTAMPEAITKVVMTVDEITAANINSIKLQTSASELFESSTILSTVTVEPAKGDLTFILDNPQADLYYRIVIDCAAGSSNGLIQISKVQYFYKKVIDDKKTEVALEWSDEKAEVILGEEAEFTYPALTVTPEEAKTAIIYTSSKPEIAEIDENGVITPKAHGTTVISATIAADDETYTTAHPVTYTLSVNDPKIVIIDPATLKISGTSYKYYEFNDAPNHITYSAVCVPNNSGIGFNKGNTNGKASSIVITDNNRLGRKIKSVTVELIDGKVNIYAQNKNFDKPVLGTAWTAGDLAETIAENAVSGTYEVGFSAIAIVPAVNNAMAIKSVKIKYTDEYVCHFTEEELTPEVSFEENVTGDGTKATITFNIAKSNGQTIHFLHTPAVVPGAISLMAVDHGDFTQAELTEGEGDTDTHTINVGEAGTLQYYGFHTASETKGVTREVKISDHTIETGVEGVAADNIDTEAVYYNLNGVRIDAENLVPGIYVRHTGSKSEKVVVK